MEIPFNKPYYSAKELAYIQKAIEYGDLSGNGYYTRACETFLKQLTGSAAVLLTPSCTAALEMAALLIDINEGDEVIMSSFNFVSAANAFALRGARIVFVDVRPDTMNIDENLIENAITPRTKAIVATHYGGVACEMTRIMAIAEQNHIYVIEDAAHCMDAYYNDRHLGAIGHFGTLSFHSTKNIHCGEGGALLINDERFVVNAEIIQEKGTNRRQFINNKIDKYTWVSIGSSFLLSELNAAFLYAQLQDLGKVTAYRRKLCQDYSNELEVLEMINYFGYPSGCMPNGHLFYVKCEDEFERGQLIRHLNSKGIQAFFHYIPLHTSKAGRLYSEFRGEDRYTTKESMRLLRFPCFYGFKQVKEVCSVVSSFYK